jgi:hypothetical protein
MPKHPAGIGCASKRPVQNSEGLQFSKTAMFFFLNLKLKSYGGTLARNFHTSVCFWEIRIDPDMSYMGN